MLTITFDQAAAALVTAGFTGWQVVTLNAIGWAESFHDLDAIGPNRDTGTAAQGWPDLGWLQINSYWHPWIRRNDWWPRIWTAAGCADAARTVWLAASANGRNPVDGYRAWHTYGTSTYTQALPESRAAARRAGQPV